MFRTRHATRGRAWLRARPPWECEEEISGPSGREEDDDFSRYTVVHVCGWPDKHYLRHRVQPGIPRRHVPQADFCKADWPELDRSVECGDHPLQGVVRARLSTRTGSGRRQSHQTRSNYRKENEQPPPRPNGADKTEGSDYERDGKSGAANATE